MKRVILSQPEEDGDRMPMDRQTTLTTIAEEAGVSRMTVSRVLRNARYVAPETRARVLDAVEKLRYHPNPMVAALMAYVRSGSTEKRVGVLAYLTSSTQRGGWRTHKGYLGIYRGARARAELLGYGLEEFWVDDPAISPARLSQILYAQGICGAIVAPMSSAESLLQLDWEKLSAVAIGYSLVNPALSRSVCDQYQCMIKALEALWELGYRRIGCALGWDDDARVHFKWSAAYLSFHQRHGIADFPALYLPRQWNRQEFIHWVYEVQPDVVISTHHEVPIRLHEAGYTIPEKIGFAHVDLLEGNEPYAGIDQRPAEIGYAAVDLVVGQLNRNEIGLPARPRTVMQDGDWVEGPTVRRQHAIPI